MPKCICYTHVVMEVIGAHDPMIWIGTCLLGKTNMTVGHESLHSRLTLSSDYFILASLASLKCRSWGFNLSISKVQMYEMEPWISLEVGYCTLQC